MNAFSSLMMLSMMGQSLNGCGCNSWGNLDFGYGSGWGMSNGYGNSCCGGNSIWSSMFMYGLGALAAPVLVKGGAALIDTISDSIGGKSTLNVHNTYQNEIAAKQAEIDKELKKMPEGFNTDKTYNSKDVTVEQKYLDAITNATAAKGAAETALNNGKSFLEKLEKANEDLATDSTSTTKVVDTTTYGTTTGSNADLKQAIKDAITKQKTENARLEKEYNDAVTKEKEANDAKEAREKEINETKTKLDKLFKELKDLYEDYEDTVFEDADGIRTQRTKDDKFDAKYDNDGNLKNADDKVTIADLRAAALKCTTEWKKTDNKEARKAGADRLIKMYDNYKGDKEVPKTVENAYLAAKAWIQREYN